MDLKPYWNAFWRKAIEDHEAELRVQKILENLGLPPESHRKQEAVKELRKIRDQISELLEEKDE